MTSLAEHVLQSQGVLASQPLSALPCYRATVKANSDAECIFREPADRYVSYWFHLVIILPLQCSLSLAHAPRTRKHVLRYPDNHVILFTPFRLVKQKKSCVWPRTSTLNIESFNPKTFAFTTAGHRCLTSSLSPSSIKAGDNKIKDVSRAAFKAVFSCRIDCSLWHQESQSQIK